MIRIFAIFFCAIIAHATAPAAAADQAQSATWTGFNLGTHGRDNILEIYKKCHAGAANDKKTVCRGIFGPDCIKGSYCDYIFRVTETEDEFEFQSFNLENYGAGRTPKKNVGYMIGFAPFEKVGTNLTAKCKSGITLKDFKFFAYKLNVERRTRSDTETEPISWDSIHKFGRDKAGDPISKTKFAKSCQLRLEDRIRLIAQYNGRPITNPSNAVMEINNEFILIIQANYFDSYTDEQKLMLRDGNQYKSTDGVLYTNFDNVELSGDQKKFQVPAYEFANSSASIFIPSILTAMLAYFVRL